MKRIGSLQNQEIKDVQALKVRRNREKQGLFTAEGYHLIEEALACNWPVNTVYVQESLLEDPGERGRVLRTFTARLEQQRIRIVFLSDDVFGAVSDTETPQGVLATVALPKGEEAPPVREGDRILVLDRIQDPGNVGTLIRTADAAGFDQLWLVKGTADPFSSKVLRASQGATFRTAFRFTESAEETLTLLHQSGKRVLVTTPRNAVNCYQVPMKENFGLVIGNEGQGVSEPFLQGADVCVQIPMEGKTESLNAAIAAAVLLFESVRQRTM